MEADKNLRVRIPPPLLANVEKAARAEQITVDELVRDAVERRLERREWRDLLAFGEKRAKSPDLTEADVPEAIAEVPDPLTIGSLNAPRRRNRTTS